MIYNAAELVKQGYSRSVAQILRMAAVSAGRTQSAIGDGGSESPLATPLSAWRLPVWISEKAPRIQGSSMEDGCR